MAHMPATGVSGLDLYVKNADGHLRFLGNGRPVAVTTTAKLADNLPPGQREYTLYLPLYNGVSSVEIGVPKDVPLLKAPVRPADRQKPIVFYGTSITKADARRGPGMCHTAILGRRLDRPTINLGFSGNGRMEPEIAALLAEIDAAAYVIEAVPNMDAKLVSERAEPLVQTIRKAHPNTPIVLVEDPTWPNTFLVETRRHGNQAESLPPCTRRMMISSPRATRIWRSLRRQAPVSGWRRYSGWNASDRSGIYASRRCDAAGVGRIAGKVITLWHRSSQTEIATRGSIV